MATGGQAGTEPASRSGEVKRRLFLSAEKLAADQGFEAVTSRDITALASANLAAINYHYGSKNALLLEIFRTRAAELNRERAALLRQAQAAQPVTVRAILHALIAPSILWTDGERRTALRFLNRARGEGPAEMREIIRTDVRHLTRFADALVSAFPNASRDELIWKLHFALGVLHHNSAADYDRLAILSDGACDPDDRQALLDHMLDFITAGFGR